MERLGDIIKRLQKNFPGMTKKQAKKLIKHKPKRLKNPNLATISILECLLGFCRKTQKWYCFPSQDLIIENLAKYKKIHISKRTLNYHLKWLEKAGYIRRQRRFKIYARHFIKPMSTLYFLLDKAKAMAHGKIKSALAWLKEMPGFRVRFFNQYQVKEEDLDKPIPLEELNKRLRLLIQTF